MSLVPERVIQFLRYGLKGGVDVPAPAPAPVIPDIKDIIAKDPLSRAGIHGRERYLRQLYHLLSRGEVPDQSWVLESEERVLNVAWDNSRGRDGLMLRWQLFDNYRNIIGGNDQTDRRLNSRYDSMDERALAYARREGIPVSQLGPTLPFELKVTGVPRVEKPVSKRLVIEPKRNANKPETKVKPQKLVKEKRPKRSTRQSFGDDYWRAINRQVNENRDFVGGLMMYWRREEEKLPEAPAWDPFRYRPRPDPLREGVSRRAEEGLEVQRRIGGYSRSELRYLDHIGELEGTSMRPLAWAYVVSLGEKGSVQAFGYHDWFEAMDRLPDRIVSQHAKDSWNAFCMIAINGIANSENVTPTDRPEEYRVQINPALVMTVQVMERIKMMKFIGLEVQREV